MTRPAVVSGTAACQQTTEYKSLVSDNSTLDLPICFCPYPRLKHYGYMHWVIIGEYSSDGGAATNTIGVTLMVDGSAVGSEITSSTISVFGAATAGTIKIEGKLMVLGGLQNTASQQQLELQIAVDDHAFAQKINDRKTQRYTISEIADHTIGLRVRKVTASPAAMTTNTLEIRSINCLPSNISSGS